MSLLWQNFHHHHDAMVKLFSKPRRIKCSIESCSVHDVLMFCKDHRLHNLFFMQCFPCDHLSFRAWMSQACKTFEQKYKLLTVCTPCPRILGETLDFIGKRPFQQDHWWCFQSFASRGELVVGWGDLWWLWILVTKLKGAFIPLSSNVIVPLLHQTKLSCLFYCESQKWLSSHSSTFFFACLRNVNKVWLFAGLFVSHVSAFLQ